MVDLVKMACSPFADIEASDSLRGGLQNSLTSLCYLCLFIYIMMKTNFMRICRGRMKEVFQLHSVRIIVDFVLLICYVVKWLYFHLLKIKCAV
jgi:hypothetical protein